MKQFPSFILFLSWSRHWIYFMINLLYVHFILSVATETINIYNSLEKLQGGKNKNLKFKPSNQKVKLKSTRIARKQRLTASLHRFKAVQWLTSFVLFVTSKNSTHIVRRHPSIHIHSQAVFYFSTITIVHAHIHMSTVASLCNTFNTADAKQTKDTQQTGDTTMSALRVIQFGPYVKTVPDYHGLHVVLYTLLRPLPHFGRIVQLCLCAQMRWRHN